MKIPKHFIFKCQGYILFPSSDWQVNRLSEIEGVRLVSVLPYPLAPVLQYKPYTNMCDDLFPVGNTEIIFESCVFENRINGNGIQMGRKQSLRIIQQRQTGW